MRVHDVRAFLLTACVAALVSSILVVMAWPGQACAKCGSPPYPEHAPLLSEVIDQSPTGYASELAIFEETVVFASTGPGAHVSAGRPGAHYVLIPVSEDVVVFGWLW